MIRKLQVGLARQLQRPLRWVERMDDPVGPIHSAISPTLRLRRTMLGTPCDIHMGVALLPQR